MNKLSVNNIKKKTQIAKYEALSIATYLFSLDQEREYFNTKKIKTTHALSTIVLGNWRLNQILYLLQIFHYVKYGYLLFKDDLYAFDNGPLIPSVYNSFWELYNNEWLGEKEIVNIKEVETKNFIAKYYNYFRGNYTNKDLEEFYNEDPAWLTNWQKKKSDPRLHLDLKYYETFLPSHIRYIEGLN